MSASMEPRSLGQCLRRILYTAFEPGDDWHTCRLAVRGDEISVFIDGAFVLFAIDGQLPSGGEIGIWTYGAIGIVRTLSGFALE